MIERLQKFSETFKARNKSFSLFAVWKDEYLHMNMLVKELSVTLLVDESNDFSELLTSRSSLYNEESELCSRIKELRRKLSVSNDSCRSNASDIATNLRQCNDLWGDTNTKLEEEEKLLKREINEWLTLNRHHVEETNYYHLNNMLDDMFRNIDLLDSPAAITAVNSVKNSVETEIEELIRNHSHSTDVTRYRQHEILSDLRNFLSEDEIERFIKLGYGKSNYKLQDRLKVTFPNFDTQTIQYIRNFYELWCTESRRLHGYQAKFKKDWENLKKDGKARLRFILQNVEKKAAMNVYDSELTIKKLKLRRKIQFHHEKQQIQKEKEACIERDIENNRVAEERILKMKFENENRLKKERIAEYCMAKEEKVAEQRLQESENIKAKEMKQQSQRRKNDERIDYRRSLLAQKKKLNEEEKWKMIERERKRQIILEQIAKQVPYHDALLCIKSKIHQITVAAAANAEQFQKIDKARGYHPLFGYDDETLLKNKAFRLSVALSEAGLHNTKAGQNALKMELKIDEHKSNWNIISHEN